MQWHWELINTLKALKCFFYVKLLLKCICFCYTDRASISFSKYLYHSLVCESDWYSSLRNDVLAKRVIAII